MATDINFDPTLNSDQAKDVQKATNAYLVILMAQIANMANQSDQINAFLSKLKVMKANFDDQETALAADEAKLSTMTNQDFSKFSIGDAQAQMQLIAAQMQQVQADESLLSNTQNKMGALYMSGVAPAFSMIQQDGDMGGMACRYFSKIYSRRA